MAPTARPATAYRLMPSMNSRRLISPCINWSYSSTASRGTVGFFGSITISSLRPDLVRSGEFLGAFGREEYHGFLTVGKARRRIRATNHCHTGGCRETDVVFSGSHPDIDVVEHPGPRTKGRQH